MKKENKQNLIGFLIVVSIIILTIIFVSTYKSDYQKEIEKRNAPLTEDDFKILSVGWNDPLEKNPGQEAWDSWEEKCNYCLTGILGTQDYSDRVEKEIRCTIRASYFTLQSSKNITGNFIIDGVKTTENERWWYENGINSHAIPRNLRFDKDNDIIFCAKSADAFNNEDHEEVCKSVTLEAKC